MRRDIFRAIADPTRREIIHLVSNGPMNINAVAENFPISRPAISKHLKILEECGVLVFRKQGREKICEAKLDTLQEVSEWVSQYRISWEEKLDDLDNYLTEIPTKESKKIKASTYSFAK